MKYWVKLEYYIGSCSFIGIPKYYKHLTIYIFIWNENKISFSIISACCQELSVFTVFNLETIIILKLEHNILFTSECSKELKLCEHYALWCFCPFSFVSGLTAVHQNGLSMNQMLMGLSPNVLPGPKEGDLAGHDMGHESKRMHIEKGNIWLYGLVFLA